MTKKLKGVKWNNRDQRWEVQIHHHGITEYLGSDRDQHKAGIIYDLRAIQLGKETNFLKPKK